jgi:hypothetical protein
MKHSVMLAVCPVSMLREQTMDETRKLAQAEQASRLKEQEGDPATRKRMEKVIMRVVPVLAALDTDHNGYATEDELIVGVRLLLAAAAIIWLLAPNPARLRRRAGADVSGDLVETLMHFDRNGDGKLDRSEVPERMQGLFDHADTNKDGLLTPEEIRTLAKAQALPVHR